jgi:hypothetical protein
MKEKLRRCWPALKLLLAAVLLLVIGRRFFLDLQRPELWQRPLGVGWLALAGLLYLAGLGFSAWYWRRLLGHLDRMPPRYATLRAYYVGHLGKYLPGKAWAVILRATLIRAAGTSVGVATLTTFYEVLVTMASGVLVATVLFACLAPSGGGGMGPAELWGLLRLEAPDRPIGRPVLVALSLGLTALFVGVLAPPVFNRVVGRLSLPFRDPAAKPPAVRWAHLAEGLGITAAGWLFLGASLAATVQGICGPDISWTPEALARLPAVLGLSYVVGFVIIFAPGGLGVREFFLTLLLKPELLSLGTMTGEEAQGVVVLAVLLLRLLWTAAELLVAGPLYALARHRSVRSVS